MPKGEMEKNNQALWVKTFRLCGLYKHPERLTKPQRRHQKLLVYAVADDIQNWPEHSHIARWYDWYENEASKET